MKALRRVLVYALVTVIIEGSSVIILFSLGYPNNLSARGSLAFLVFYNLVFYFLWGNAIGGPPPVTSSDGSWIYNPIAQVVGGVLGMFMIISVTGEVILWLRGEIRDISNEAREFWRSITAKP